MLGALPESIWEEDQEAVRLPKLTAINGANNRYFKRRKARSSGIDLY
jgi:hypothetical protein